MVRMVCNIALLEWKIHFDLTSFKERGFESYSPTLIGKGLFLLGLYFMQLRTAIYAIAIWKQPEAIAHQYLKPLFFFSVCSHLHRMSQRVAPWCHTSLNFWNALETRHVRFIYFYLHNFCQTRYIKW